MKLYPFDSLYPLLHEICHYYSNSLFYKYWPEMQKASDTVFPYISGIVAKYAYGNAQITTLEWQNNLFSVMQNDYKIIYNTNTKSITTNN